MLQATAERFVLRSRRMQGDARFTVRTYADGDEGAILDLFARSFPHAPRSLEHFGWKYRQNPFGNGRIVLTYDEAGWLVGHYSGYPVPFRYSTHDLVANQIGDTMTDPAVRHIGRGRTSILGRTALEFYERFCHRQVAFNYGFNVSNIQRFSLRFLRSDRVEPVSYRLLDPRATPPRFVQRRGPGDWSTGGFSLELVKDVGPEWDEFFGRASGGYELLVRRDAAYVRWRYLERPDADYSLVAIRKWRQLVGWVVYRTERTRLLLGDMLLHREMPEALDHVLQHVLPLHGPETVEAWLPLRPRWLSDYVDTLGFERRQEPQDLSLMCVPFQLADATEVMRSSLYYTWGDSDLF